MLTDAQLALRRTGIGGSDIAAILGESRFASPFDVWLSKVHGWRQEETEDMRRGSFLEDGCARWYLDRHAGVTAALGETTRHATHPWALCTPDRLLTSPAWSGTRLLSIKMPRRSAGWGEPGSSDVPEEYALQLQWEHAVMGSHGPMDDTMHLAAVLDGSLSVFVLRADPETQADLLAFAGAWWQRHVVEGVEPSMDGSEQAKAWLRSRYPKHTETSREATHRENALLAELRLARDEADRWGRERELIENQLRAAMGECAKLVSPIASVTWRTDKRGQKTFRVTWADEK